MKKLQVTSDASADQNVASEGNAGGMVGGAPLEGRVSFKVHRVSAKLAQVASSLFRMHKLDPISSRILVLLLERESMRVGEIVDLMVLPQSTLSHQLQRLEKSGLITRRRMKEDNRSVAVSLTVAGKSVAIECDALSIDVYRHITGDLNDKEIADLGHLLGKLFSALESYRVTALADGAGSTSPD